MVDSRYNTPVNHIKSDGLLKQHRHHFSTDVRGIDTMSHSTRSPYFPANLDYFAPWVAAHGLSAPYGECQCGCGQATPVAKKNRPNQKIRQGHPVRFIQGHNGRKLDDAPDGFKTCAQCVSVKPLSDYYQDKHGKYSSHCIDCNRSIGREYHYANKQKRLPQMAEYRHANKEQLSAKERERRADPAYREKVAQELKQWREQNRDYIAAYNRSLPAKARGAVNKAVRSGKLPPPDTMVCDSCDEALAAHYHHFNGYEREHWFDIEPLCTECHGREHRVS